MKQIIFWFLKPVPCQSVGKRKQAIEQTLEKHISSWEETDWSQIYLA